MAKKDEDRLRAAFEALAAGATPGADCPEPERLWAAVQGGLELDETDLLLEHAMDCAACAEAWRLARDVLVAVPEAVEMVAGSPSRPVAPRYRRNRGALGWAALAASLFLAAVLVAVDGRLPLPASSAPAYRAASENRIRSELAPGSRLLREAFVLRWTGPEDAVYAVEVAREDLTVLLRATGLAASELQVPGDLLVPIPAGESIVWQVAATLPDGTIAYSSSFVTRVREPASTGDSP